MSKTKRAQRHTVNAKKDFDSAGPTPLNKSALGTVGEYLGSRTFFLIKHRTKSIRKNLNAVLLLVNSGLDQYSDL